MADPDAKDAPKPPPNLRVATSEDKECDQCSHYGRGRCELPILKDFVLPVDGEWVCDSFDPSGKPDPDAKNLKGAERNALKQVRSEKASG